MMQEDYQNAKRLLIDAEVGTSAESLTIMVKRLLEQGRKIWDALQIDLQPSA